MQMLYNSDAFVVVQFDVPVGPDTPARGGYEIVDKFAKKEIYIEGALAESFKAGVEKLAQGEPSADDLDAFIEGYASWAQQPLAVH